MKNKKYIKLTFLGDVLCDKQMADLIENYRDSDKCYNFTSVFNPVKSTLESSDYVFANLETPLTKDESKLTKKRWEFCTHYNFAKALKDAGVSYMATSNNHCLDRGIQGVTETINCLNELNIAHSGTYVKGEKRIPLIVEIEGKKVGILSYTYGTNAQSNGQYLGIRTRRIVDLIQEQEGAVSCFNLIARVARGRLQKKLFNYHYKRCDQKWPENKNVEWYEKRNINGYRLWLLNRDIKWLKQQKVDLIVTYLHIGGQYNHKPNPYTIEMTEWLRKKVDIVIANHEHVIHSACFDKKNNSLVTYALGNFLGSAGTLHEPYTRVADYSVAVHSYIDRETNRVDKVTYSLFKTIYTSSNKFEVWPIAEYLKIIKEDEKIKIIKEAQKAAREFAGTLPTEILAEIDLISYGKR